MPEAATIAWALQLLGAFFFLAGAIGLLRFPDTLSRLHALTKVDNLGLGFILIAAAIHDHSPGALLRLAMIWLITLATSATTCHLVAGRVASPNGEQK